MNAKRSWNSGRWDAVCERECVPVTTHLNPSVALFKGLSTHTRKKSRVYQTGETGGKGREGARADRNDGRKRLTVDGGRRKTREFARPCGRARKKVKVTETKPSWNLNLD